MIASLHICCSVWNDQLCFFQDFSYCTCINISLVTPSCPGNFLLFFVCWLTAVWTPLSARHSFMWSDVILLLLFLFSVLLLFDVSYWLRCYLHLHLIICYLPICTSPYHHSLSRLMQLSNCHRHSIVWQVSKASDNPVRDSKWLFCFFLSFHWSCYRMPGKFDPQLQHYNGYS